MRIVFGRTGVIDGPGGRRITDRHPEWSLAEGEGDDWTRLIARADVAVPIISPVTGALLEGSSVRLVQQFGVGLDTVDREACALRGIPVANVPSTVAGNALSVAELALALVLELARDLPGNRAAVGGTVPPPSRTLAGRRVLLVGLGGLGAAIAARLAAFDVHVTAIRAHPERGGAPGVAEVLGPDDLDAALPLVDGTVLAATPGGRLPMLDAARLARMRPGAFLVNVARGALVDEPALLAALDDGTLSGAGLDVLAHEPMRADDPVVVHPRTIVTPHIGAVTVENLVGSADAVADNIERFAAGEPLRWRA